MSNVREMVARVLLVVKGLGPGGAERLLVASTRHADARGVSYHCSFVLPNKDQLVAEMAEGGVRSTCLSRGRWDVTWPMRLRSLIKAGDFDIVHGHSPLPMSIARLVVLTMRRRHRPALVSTEHNAWSTFHWATRLLNSATAGRDAAIFAVSDEARKSMRDRVAQRAVTLIHGIDVGAAAAAGCDRSVVRGELGLSSDEFVICTVANFRAQKDYPNLLNAASELVSRGVPFRLVAVGQGPLESSVRATVDELRLGDHVVLTGFRPDATRVMAAADAFTLASKWEGLPVALMEACAIGLPIVATAVGGVREQFRDGVDALLVPPGDHVRLADAIESVASDRVLRGRLSAASSERSVDFDVSRAQRVVEGTYAQLTKDRSGECGVESVRRPLNGLEIRPATPDDHGAIHRLLERSLGWDGDPRFAELFAWKHEQNPFGRSPMWVATDGGRVVAFRAFMRWEFIRDGQVLRAVRAVDTATDPEYQGRGLFTALTLHGLDAIRDEVSFVFNTPNEQSRPGYLKMGWRDVGRLPVAVAVTRPTGMRRMLGARLPAELWSEQLAAGVPLDEWVDGVGATAQRPGVGELSTNRSLDYLAWRYALPSLGYRAISGEDCTLVVRCRRRGRAMELVIVDWYGQEAAVGGLSRRAGRASGADYCIRLGAPKLLRGVAPLPGLGPTLTWKSVRDDRMPSISSWNLSMGDVELF